MEINGPRRVDSASLRRTGRSAPSSGSAFAAEEPADAKQAAALTGSGPITALDTILALQSVDDSTDHRSQGLKQGDHLLGLLDEVRDGLLMGGIPRATLNRLALAISKRRETFADPHLQSVLDEIDLRARVELAKLEQADLAAA